MLTAIRVMAETAEADLAAARWTCCSTDVLVAADEIVRRTREMLPALTEAGVVDAGAAGLVEFARGAVAGLRGERPPTIAALEDAPIGIDAVHARPSTYRYCTTFVLEGERVDRERLEALLDPLGDSLLVVGESPTFKVHVHTDDPGAALTLGVAMGTVDRVEIANMHDQTEQRTLRLLAQIEPQGESASGLVAVVSGDANEAAFRALGATTVIGGQTMNPSTQQLADAIAEARRRRGRRAAQQRQRDPGRRACGCARDPAGGGGGDPHHRRRTACRRARLRPRAARAEQRRGDGGRA